MTRLGCRRRQPGSRRGWHIWLERRTCRSLTHPAHPALPLLTQAALSPRWTAWTGPLPFSPSGCMSGRWTGSRSCPDAVWVIWPMPRPGREAWSREAVPCAGRAAAIRPQPSSIRQDQPSSALTGLAAVVFVGRTSGQRPLPPRSAVRRRMTLRLYALRDLPGERPSALTVLPSLRGERRGNPRPPGRRSRPLDGTPQGRLATTERLCKGQGRWPLI